MEQPIWDYENTVALKRLHDLYRYSGSRMYFACTCAGCQMAMHRMQSMMHFSRIEPSHMSVVYSSVSVA